MLVSVSPSLFPLTHPLPFNFSRENFVSYTFLVKYRTKQFAAGDI
jgi:hypothetical protein